MVIIGSHADIRQSETIFQVLIEATDVMILVLRDGYICYANPTVKEITGYTEAELRVHTDLYQHIQKQEKQQYIASQRQEAKLIKKNGEECYLNYSLKTITFEGKPAKLLTAVDITKHKQVEKRIQQTLEREKEIGENRLQFISMISHELRVPLKVISFATNLLKLYSECWSHEKKQEYFNRLQKGVEMLNLLIDEVLIIGRMETGKLTCEPKPLDLLQFCHNLLAELYPNDRYQHHINFSSQGNSSLVSVDKRMLQLILTNLLENAVKYSPDGSIVSFLLSYQSEKVIFQIKDQGIGIAPTDLEKLFEPFYRGKNVGDLPGNGLGLAMQNTNFGNLLLG
ncbi:PAS domain-containing sensor histidine kinase [Nostoc sp. UHCC 0870]|uniref:PAS domain-containing sensor histidine kinase n=1 Tax=Nostoc sp. UHCC 0870 TaxID=2914041 RepID=UPI001EDF7F3E|nr:PAS domain-containing sensor histidine kinase [Nostoc sp. UHCC 0870]UKO95916.1 PAS domain-containing sensor histidine kinase [Nostoc sp. UHCC 0870]